MHASAVRLVASLLVICSVLGNVSIASAQSQKSQQFRHKATQLQIRKNRALRHGHVFQAHNYQIKFEQLRVGQNGRLVPETKRKHLKYLMSGG